MSGRQIKTKPDQKTSTTVIGGWFQGRGTYLWIGDDKRCYATISGPKLYRLAKAVVRHFDSEKR